jgi:hypothetical protein
MARTDSNGAAVLRCRVTPRDEVVATLTGYKLARSWVRREVRDTFYFVCELDRWAKRTVVGHVVTGSTGLPVAGAVAELGRRNVRTDVTGRFVLSEKCRSRTDLRVRYPGYPYVTRTLAAGRGDTLLVRAVLFDSTSTGSVTGLVVAPRDSEPLVGCSVHIEGTLVGAATGTDGRFTIDKIPPGDYQLLVSSMGYDESRRWVSVTPGLPVVSDFTLGPTIIRLW